MNIEDIIVKYGYNDQLKKILEKMYPLLVEYFGDEELVYNTLSNVEIVLAYDLMNYLDEQDFYSEEDKKYSKELSELDYCFGAYCINPIVEYRNSAYELKEVKSVILFRLTDDGYYDYMTSTLAHEICHMIKSMKNACEIKNDTLTVCTGFRKTIYQLSNNGGKVSKIPVLEYGVGLEEGLNTVFEEEIANKIYKKRFKYETYDKVRDMAYELLNISDELKKAIIRVSVNHNYEELDKLLGISTYELMDIFEKVFAIDNEYLSSYADQAKRSKLNEEASRIKAFSFNPIIKRIIENFGNERKM